MDIGSMIGELLGHYRIVEQIGAGGMGVVFRARDERLNRDVALKVLPTETVRDEAARARFRREALALSRLNHPNIAIVHDFDTQQGIDLLVTEYIPGVTLDEHLTSQPIAEREAIRLAIQLSEGLEAAHEQGIVHRDLKPGNLRLTPAGRLKILDFGLARRTEVDLDEAATTPVTRSQQVTGTLPYMAPEQLRGEKADPRTDLWAAGAVLYEMVTGRRPFDARTAPMLIDAILNADPTPAREINPAISPGLEAIIEKALDKDPRHRYQSASELRIDLERLALKTSTRVRPPARPAAGPRLRVALIAGTAGLLALAAIVLLRGRLPATGEPGPGLAPAAAARVVRRSIAVLGFRELSEGEHSGWMSTALAEMLTTELAAGESLRTLPGESVSRARADLGLGARESLARESLHRLRANLGADLIVVGSLLVLGRDVRVDVRLQDTRAGDTVATLSEKGGIDRLDDLAVRIGARLREHLRLREVSATEAAQARAAMPRDPVAARHYAEGLQKLWSYDAAGARDLLERADEAEPGFALIHSALAMAWAELGWEQKAKVEAARAFELSSGLARQDRMAIEGAYRESAGELGKAIEIYRTLFGFFPDDLRYGLKLANLQISADDGAGALATLAALRALPEPARDDPAIDLAEAIAAGAVSNFERERALTEQAAAKARARGNRLLLARARRQQGSVLRRVGDPDGARAALEEARTIYLAAGDRVGEAFVLNALGNLVSDQGDYETARGMYETALAAYRAVDNRFGMAAVLDNIAIIVGDRGDPAAALALSQEALALYRELGDSRGIANTLNNIAATYVQRGESGRAAEMFEETLVLRRQIGDRSGEAVSLTNLAEIRREAGRLEESRTMYAQSLALFRSLGQTSAVSYPLIGGAVVLTLTGELAAAANDLEEAVRLCDEIDDPIQGAFARFGLAEVERHRGRLDVARRLHEQALATRERLGEKGRVADSRLALSLLALERGGPAEARRLARQALDEFSAEGRRREAIDAHATLALALLAEGTPDQARAALAAGRALLTAGGEGGVRIAVAAARLAAADGDASALRDALAELDRLDRELGRAGNVRDRLEVRLAQADVARDRVKLEALRRDADAAGFALIAQAAGAALGR